MPENIPAALRSTAPPMDAATTRTRDLCKTLLAIALVCIAMPFLTISNEEISHTVSLWQIGTRLRRLDLVKELPDTVASMILMARIMAWVAMSLIAASWIVVMTRYQHTHYAPVMISCLVALLLMVGIYFYLGYIFGKSIALTFGNGAIVLLASMLITSLILLASLIKKRTAMAVLLILLVMPATIAFGILFLGDRKYYIISLLLIIETLLPFFMVFEQRRPQARELILIAVMAAIAVIGRAAFYMFPAFKPLVAIVIIAGVSLGPEAGFLVGALSGFVSNFLFGQGPWAPWQMFAYGICGFLAGLLFKKGWLSKKTIPLAIFGGCSIMLVCGPLLDLCAFFTMAMQQTSEMFWALLLSGIPYNGVHATATVIFLLILAKPMNKKLDRIKQKYGMMEP